MVDTSSVVPCSSQVERLDGSCSFGHCSVAGRSSDPSQEPDACVCWFGRQASGHSEIRVKNTFIQAFLVDEDSDEEDGLPMVKVKTCPLVRVRSDSTSSTSAGDSSWDDSLAQHEPVVGSRMVEQQAAPCHGEAADGLPRPQIVPLESRTPEVSIGSSLHGEGHCKPCAWFWRPQGCENGSECRHCHLCSATELKARRKAKASSRKSYRKPATLAAPMDGDLAEELQTKH